MKVGRLILTVAVATAMAMMAVGCGDDTPAEKVAGEYKCVCTVGTQYEKNGVWRDTSYVSSRNERVKIEVVDKQTVRVSLSAQKYGEATFENVELRDWNFMANLSGSGSIEMANNGRQYDCRLSGSYTYDSKAMAMTVTVQNHSPRLNLSFTNTTY